LFLLILSFYQNSLKTEIISITDDQGVLDIRGGKYDSVLLLNGALIQFTYLREIVSTWRYQIAKGLTGEWILSNKEYQSLVRAGALSNKPLSIQFQYLIQFLCRGRYRLELSHLEPHIAVHELSFETHGLPPDFEGYFDHDTYGGMKEVIETQAIFKEEIVIQYEQLITKGLEPIVILLQANGSENSFLIDGHHKITAYRRLGVPVKCLQVTKLDATKIRKSEGVDFIRMFSANAEFEKRYLTKV
jgi:hypothetical protein